MKKDGFIKNPLGFDSGISPINYAPSLISISIYFLILSYYNLSTIVSAYYLEIAKKLDLFKKS